MKTDTISMKHESAEQESGRNAGRECTCKSNGSVPGIFHGTGCPLQRNARLIFPCGAYFPVKHGDEALDAAHRARDGAYRIGVYPSSQPHATEETVLRVQKEYGKAETEWMDRSERAPCLFFCPVKKRRKVERGWDSSGIHGHFVSCHARLCSQEHIEEGDQGWYDITPMPPAKCPHCEEQRTYVQACRHAAQHHEEAPDRAKWRKCPQCEQYREVTLDTGLCASCQLVQVIEENHG